jgi:aquaporin Z
MFNLKVFLAEFTGTFALVFIGASAGVVGAGIVGVALAHGFTLAVFYYAYGHISGAHVNPAVTFGLALNGTLKWGQAVFYWLAQFAGGILAAFVLNLAISSLGANINNGATVGALTEAQPMYAMGVEIILTFFLVNTILHTAVAGKGGKFAGWAIGSTLAFVILAGGPLTGASVNPARTLGPAIFSDQSLTSVYTYVIYLFGPLIGATLAVMAFNFFSTTEDEDAYEEEVEVKAAKKPVVRKTTKASAKPVARKTAKK